MLLLFSRPLRDTQDAHLESNQDSNKVNSAVSILVLIMSTITFGLLLETLPPSIPLYEETVAHSFNFHDPTVYWTYVERLFDIKVEVTGLEPATTSSQN